LVDVPDLQLLPREWPQTAEVWVGAAPAPALLHRVLYCCAWLVRLRLLPGIGWLAATMHWASSQLRWGEARGGMFVAVQGIDVSGRKLQRQWHLLAEADSGPLIPSMGAAALINQLLAGAPPAAGARPGIHDLELSNYEALFAQQRIHAGVRDIYADSEPPLFERMLGSAWARLPQAIRQLHSVTSSAAFSGRCTVRRGRNPLARLMARIVGFPAAREDQPVKVQILVDSDGERWIRTTGIRSFSSTLRAGRGRCEWLVRERFGLVTVDIALVADGDKLHYVIRGCSLLGVPLPQALSPRTSTTESAADGVFHFDVEISHLLTGLIVRYRGWLAAGQGGATASRLAIASRCKDRDPPC
jgi:hypothetical protein